MGYTILSASKFTSKLKATIHTSGKLGFTEVTAKELGFGDSTDNYIQFAQDDDNPEILYLINDAIDDGDSFRVSKAGKYYYVNTKLLFDSLGIDYVNSTVIFDMIKTKVGDKEMYKMTPRALRKTKQDTE